MSVKAGIYNCLKLGHNGIQQRCVQVTQVRYRRIQSRNPPEPHFDRKAMLEVCKPIYPTSEKVCGNVTRVVKEYEPHPWNVLKANRLRATLEEASMILFYHKNPVKLEANTKIHNMLFKKELYLQPSVSNEVIRLAIKDTFLANATPFTISRNAIVVSPHTNIGVALRLSKKMPQYILLAGVVDRQFLSRDQLQWLSTVPSIQSIQAVTAGLLSAHAQRLYSNLNQHQQRLSGLLAERAKSSDSSSATMNTASEQAPSGDEQN